MIRFLALSSVALALMLGATSCREDSPAPASARTSATAGPSSPAPDREFADPAGTSGPTLGDYVGRWVTADMIIPPCHGRGLDKRLSIDVDGMVLLPWSSTLALSRQLFGPGEVVDGRFTAPVSAEWSGACGPDVSLVLDCRAGQASLVARGDVLQATRLGRLVQGLGTACIS